MGTMITKGIPKLEAIDISSFSRLLHIHAKLYYIQEELEKILVLSITTLHSKG